MVATMLRVFRVQTANPKNATTNMRRPLLISSVMSATTTVNVSHRITTNNMAVHRSRRYIDDICASLGAVTCISNLLMSYDRYIRVGDVSAMEFHRKAETLESLLIISTIARAT